MNQKAAFGPEPYFNKFEMESDLWYGVLLCTLCGIGVIINGIMIAVFMMESKRKHYFNITYLNLSCSDFFWALYGLCIEGPNWIRENGFSGIRAMCFLQPILFYLFAHGNLLAMLPITYDRFVAVITPLRYTKGRHAMHQKILIACCWISSLIFLIFVLSEVYAYKSDTLLKSISYDSAGHQCSFNFQDKESIRQQVSLTSTILFGMIPLLINVLTYILILYKLYRIRSVKVRMVSHRAILICGFFTLSWMPCLIMYDILGKYELRKFYHVALYLNCLSDPVLYAFTSRLMKKRLGQLQVRRSQRRFGRTRTGSPRATFHFSVNIRVFIRKISRSRVSDENITPDPV